MDVNLFTHLLVLQNPEDNFLYGRPVNPYRQSFKLPDYPDVEFANRLYNEFEELAKEVTWQVYNDDLQPGLYDKAVIDIIQGLHHNYYTLKKPRRKK